MIILIFSHNAAKFYNKNRYMDATQCNNPCHSMHVTTNLVSKSHSNSTLVKLTFPRKVDVIQEKYIKSPLSLGKLLYKEE